MSDTPSNEREPRRPAEEGGAAAPPHQCAQCGLTLPVGTPAGMCPKCLLLGVPDTGLDSSHDLSRSSRAPSTHPPNWEPPSVAELHAMLPQYEVMELLGRGGMGAVYKGRQPALDRFVAIKILPADLGGEDHNFAERFKLEARAMAKLTHPGIVAVYDFGQTSQGLLYFVMEFVQGMDVQRMIALHGRQRSANALAIVAHVCDALQYAHEHGIVHRDIKPANVIVGYDGRVKVADFGLAKVTTAGQTSSFTMSGNLLGTPHYIAPEALILGVSVDHRADLYAVGVLLYQMLTGKLPQGVFEMPSLQVPGLDPRFDRIIAKAMREDRDQRYQTASELRMDLEGIITQPLAQTVPMPPEEDPGPPAPSRSASRLVRRPPTVVPAEEDQAEREDDDMPPADAIPEMTGSLHTTLLVLGSIALLTIGGLAFFLANRKTGDVINTVTTVTNTEIHNSYFTQLISIGVTTEKDLQAVTDIRPYGSGFIGISKEDYSWTQVQDLARRTGAEILSVEDDSPGSSQQLLAWLAASYSSHLSSPVWVREHGESRVLKGSEVTSTTELEAPRRGILHWSTTKRSGTMDQTRPSATTPIATQDASTLFQEIESIVGSWMSPDKESEWTFEKNGAFTYRRSGESFAGKWTKNGRRISVDARSDDGTATLVRSFDMISISPTEVSLLMNGERPYIWKRVSPGSVTTASQPPTPSAMPETKALVTGPLAWTNKEGKVIQAEFIQLSGNAVVIRMDGKQFTIPFANLAPASVEQAKRLGSQPR